ncbi:hypothetical protein GGI12_001271 [Dipsacomyces acuminosporus]|nr:hypothetical protein GGI12_001271 [Dipsacomyces acuminosporus]
MTSPRMPSAPANNVDKQSPKAEQHVETVGEQADVQQSEVSGRSLLLATIGIYMLMFLIGLYTTIESVIFVPIANEFNALSRAEWIINGYMLTTTALQPIYGKVSDIAGRVPAMLTASLLLLLGSVLCAVSRSLNLFIFSRAVQGLGSAGLCTMINVVVADLYSERDRAKHMGYGSAAWALASSAGIVMGGAIVERSSWRVAFWLNVPICVIAAGIIMVLLRLPKPSGTRKEKIQRVDFVGTALSLLCIVLLLLALSWGGRSHAWSDASVICCIVFGVVAGVLFAVYEGKYPTDPIMPMRLLRTRNVAISFVSHIFFGAATFAPLYLIPLWTLVVKNSTSITSGLYLLPFTLSELVAAGAAGVWVTKTGRYRETIWLGGCALLVGISLLVLLDQHSGVGQVIGFLTVAGVGFGAGIQTLVLAAQASSSGKDSAVTTSVCIFMRALGSIIATAVLSSVSQNKLQAEFTKLSSAYPQHADDIWKIAQNQSLIHTLALPATVFDLIARAFMRSMRAAFISAIPFAALFLVSTVGLKDVKLDRQKKVTIE